MIIGDSLNNIKLYYQNENRSTDKIKQLDIKEVNGKFQIGDNPTLISSFHELCQVIEKLTNVESANPFITIS